MVYFNWTRIRNGCFQIGVASVIAGMLAMIFKGWNQEPLLAIFFGVGIILLSALGEKS